LWWVFRNLVLAFKGVGVMIWRLTMMRWWRWDYVVIAVFCDG
jgi:hypothetical protein